MKWFKIIVSDEAQARGDIKQIMDAFEHFIPIADELKSNRCALFIRNDRDTCFIFVSPQFAGIATQLIKTFSAVECEPPPPRGATEEFGTALLLTSHDQFAWSLLG